MLGAVFDLLVSLATTALAVGFIASLFLDVGAGHAGALEDDGNDEADLPPPGRLGLRARPGAAGKVR